MNPGDIDLSKRLQGYFGCVEFEDALIWIIKYLADNHRNAGIPETLYGNGPAGWGKKIRIETIPNISPTMFAMLCAAGWLQNSWFPKGAFTVTADFIKRLESGPPSRQPKNRSMKIRAKMSVNEVVSNTYSDQVKLSPVCGGGTSAEDNSFAKATPGGKLELTIDNPALKGAIKPGQVFYVDMTLIEPAGI